MQHFKTGVRKLKELYLASAPLRIGIFCFLILRWLSVLHLSDAYFSPFIIWAMAGTLAFAANLKREYARRRIPESRRTRVYTAVFSAVYSLAVLLSNYQLITPVGSNPVRIILLFIAGYVIARNILVWILNRPAGQASGKAGRKAGGEKKVFLAVFAGIAIVDLLYLFTSYYPGVISADSISQVGQILSGKYSNHHPFWHTMIINACMKFGTLLFSDINSACAVFSVFQILSMAAVFAFLVMTMYQAGISRGWLIATAAGYMLLPYHIMFSFSMWKDILFAGTVALFGCSLYRMIKGIGSGVTNYITLVIGTIGFGLLRSNGWVALLVTFIFSVFLLWKKHRKVLFVILGLLVFTFIMKHPVLQWLNVKQPDTVEYLSIPAQQIARTLSEYAELTEDEEKKIEKIMSIEEARDNYEPHISDPIKDVLRRTNQKYLTKHKMDYLKLWFQLGCRYPEQYLNAWIDQTKGYWNGGGYNYYVAETSVYYNDYEISEMENKGAVSDVLSRWIEFFFDDTLFVPLRSIGLHVWIVILALFVSVIERRKTCIIPISLVAIILTLLISTPVSSEFRYAYSVFALFPFVMLTTFTEKSAADRQAAVKPD